MNPTKPKVSLRRIVEQATLGQTLRAARLGWGWLGGIGCFVRLTDEEYGFLCDVRPPDALPRTIQGGTHRVWWTKPDDDDYVVAEQLSQVLRHVAFSDSIRYVRLDHDGALLSDETRPE